MTTVIADLPKNYSIILDTVVSESDTKRLCENCEC